MGSLILPLLLACVSGDDSSHALRGGSYLCQPAFAVDDLVRVPTEPYSPQAGDVFLATDQALWSRVGHWMAGTAGRIGISTSIWTWTTVGIRRRVGWNGRINESIWSAVVLHRFGFQRQESGAPAAFAEGAHSERNPKRWRTTALQKKAVEDHRTPKS